MMATSIFVPIFLALPLPFKVALLSLSSLMYFGVRPVEVMEVAPAVEVHAVPAEQAE